jgi:hypothetical protein
MLGCGVKQGIMAWNESNYFVVKFRNDFSAVFGDTVSFGLDP